VPIVDPDLDSQFATPRPGFFVTLEVGFLFPEMHYHLSAPVTLKGVNQQIDLPGSNLDWSLLWGAGVGYRLPGGGAFLATFRTVASDGSGVVQNLDSDGALLRSRFEMLAGDVDYLSPQIVVGPLWNLQWCMGVRVGSVFYDSTATGVNTQEKSSNHFVGSGPRAGLEFRRLLAPELGMSIFGRTEGGLLIGSTSQRFLAVMLRDDGTISEGTNELNHTNVVPVVAVQAGMSFVPVHNLPWFRVALGYQYEQWWGLGNAAESRADLLLHGLFVRGEWTY
jgi:hypothetical protein